MKSEIEKVTLSLNRQLLERLAKRSKKTRSEFVRDLIQREADMSEQGIMISPEILEMKGVLSGEDSADTKERVRQRAVKKLRSYERE